MITLVPPNPVDFYQRLKVKMKPLTDDQLDSVQLQQLLKMTENEAHTASTLHKQRNHRNNKQLNCHNQILLPV